MTVIHSKPPLRPLPRDVDVAAAKGVVEVEEDFGVRSEGLAGRDVSTVPDRSLSMRDSKAILRDAAKDLDGYKDSLTKAELLKLLGL